MRRTTLLALMVALTLTLGACATKGVGEPVRTGSNTGYVGGKSVTLIKPSDRKLAAVVAGEELDGKRKITSSDYAGKVIVFNVWGSWCAPCRKEAPGLAAASKRTTKIAQFIGIDIRDIDRAPAQAFVRAFKVPYPSIYDPDGKQLVKFSADLPPSAIPTTLIIDRQGRSAARIIGTISEATLVEIITEVSDGK